MSLVSVVIPTYQDADYVAEAIESVLAQTYQNFEIIVVDDGSTDNTSEVLAEFGDQITVIYQENRRMSAARNTGIRAAYGEYIAFLDADDVWQPTYLERLVPLFGRAENIGLICCDLMWFDENGDRPGTAFEIFPPRAGMIYPLIFTHNFMTLPMVRRACFNDVGYFDETLTGCEDQDMMLRIGKKWAVDYVNEPLYKYRISAVQMHHDYERMLVNLLRVNEKAFAESPELRQLDQDTLDRCFYDLYLQQSRVYLKKGRRSEARSVLRQYAQSRGRTFRYWQTWLASCTPGWLLNLVLATRRHIRSLWQPAAL